MGRISDEDIQRVRDATDVVSLISESVVLKKKGRLYWGRCPFHGEKTPSFKVDPGSQLWHCFGCGEGGDAFGFLMRQENLEFPEAVRLLADRGHIEIHESGEGVARSAKERLLNALDEAAAFYHGYLVSSREAGAQSAREYLKSRGFGIDVAKRFEIGFAPGRSTLSSHLMSKGFTPAEIVSANLGFPAEGGARPRDRFYDRVMFPIHDLNGRTVGFGGRVLGKGEPKYLNTQETPVFHKAQNLYAIDKAKNEIVKSGGIAVVVEGYTDVIALHEAGIRNVVATLGTALGRRHLRLLGRFATRIVYLFDADEAGLRAAERAAEFIDVAVGSETTRPVELAVAVVPDGKDPADYVAASGADAMREIIAGAEPLLQFVLDRRLSRHDLGTPEGRSAALADVARVIASVKGTILAQDYANYVADRLLVEYTTVMTAVAAAKPEFTDRDAEEDAGVATPAPSPVAVDPLSRAERALVGLVAVEPSLRFKARGLLEKDLLSDQVATRILRLVLESGQSTGAELFANVSAADPSLAAAMTGLLIDVDGNEDVDSVARSLLSKVKELGTERLIIEKKAQMKTLDPVKDRVAYDDSFREIAALQVRLEELRRGSVVDADDREVWG